jgi:hypothetical protein
MDSTLIKTVEEKLTKESKGIKATKTELGDRKASKQTVHWAAEGQNSEFEAHATTSQQDHKVNGTGIAIDKCVGRREQPWNSKIRANAHNRTINFLPSMSATKYEVRE